MPKGRQSIADSSYANTHDTIRGATGKGHLSILNVFRTRYGMVWGGGGTGLDCVIHTWIPNFRRFKPRRVYYE